MKDEEAGMRKVIKLVFYAQSASAVISGRCTFCHIYLNKLSGDVENRNEEAGMRETGMKRQG